MFSSVASLGHHHNSINPNSANSKNPTSDGLNYAPNCEWKSCSLVTSVKQEHYVETCAWPLTVVTSISSLRTPRPGGWRTLPPRLTEGLENLRAGAAPYDQPRAVLCAVNRFLRLKLGAALFCAARKGCAASERNARVQYLRCDD